MFYELFSYCLLFWMLCSMIYSVAVRYSGCDVPLTIQLLSAILDVMFHELFSCCPLFWMLCSMNYSVIVRYSGCDVPWTIQLLSAILNVMFHELFSYCPLFWMLCSMNYTVTVSYSRCDVPEKRTDLFTFAKETDNGKLHYLHSAYLMCELLQIN